MRTLRRIVDGLVARLPHVGIGARIDSDPLGRVWRFDLLGSVVLREAVLCPLLDLDRPMTRNERSRAMKALFSEFITPITTAALTRAGLISLAERGLVHLLPAVRKGLTV